ncbi:AAA family ATPase [Clavibacter zhangzhiyongii]|uniref:nSTAND1 domain-containing NTPase n=1 Tax=Clavibacter zhangzhiyongii TaxID=2768071 RepID=UPI0039DF3972
MSDNYPHLGALFGLNDEKKIAESGIRNIFTPHQPISDTDLLFGRRDEVQSLVQTLNTPGQHVLLYGERGVGKSSLANIVADMLTVLVETTVHTKRCDQSDTFESIMRNSLAEVGADLTLIGAAEEVEGSAEGGFKFAKGAIAKKVVAQYAASHSLSPSTVAEAIGDLEGLLVVDEADAIGNSEDRRKLAELIKLLSDSGSKYKVMVVGIAATGSELTAAHPSVQRCLRETKLDRMTADELRDIVVLGGEKANLTFTAPVVKAIIDLSAGYPHFTHLIALKCAERAVVAGRGEVDTPHMKTALALAVKDAEGTLKRSYEDSTRSANTSMYRSIVRAAARISSEEFSASTLREQIEKVTGDSISQGSLNNYLQRLVTDEGTSIFTRSMKGVYRFSDPRMASYVRMTAYE